MTAPEKSDGSWKTKPTDRFVLRWIKIYLSAQVTPLLADRHEIQPWMVTVASMGLGCAAGLVFGLGHGLAAGILAAAAQVLDGVDGQLARLRGTVSPAGALFDSVLDRYTDTAMVIGVVVYLIRLPVGLSAGFMLFLAFLALCGNSLVSYTKARAETLGLDLGPPTLAGKGTRMSVMIVSGLLSPYWASLPLLALIYLALHPNMFVVSRLRLTFEKRA